MKTIAKLMMKFIGVLCVFVMLLSTLYVPMSFGASAAEYSATFDFKDHAVICQKA